VNFVSERGTARAAKLVAMLFQKTNTSRCFIDQGWLSKCMNPFQDWNAAIIILIKDYIGVRHSL
jgi:hypothetical protein